MSIVVSQTIKFRRNLRGKKTPFGEKLRRLTGPVFSTHNGTGCPRMRNEKYVESYNLRGRNFLDGQKVPYYLIQAHQEHRAKLKVSAKWGLFTLVYFDLDTHTYGDPEDVRLLAQVVRQHFPTMPEFVFNERGGSGWLVVDTSGVAPAEYNGSLCRLEKYFRSVAVAMGLNVEFVEVKGKVYEHAFHAKRMVSVKAGDLLKCPPSEMYLDQSPVDAERFASSEFDPWSTVEEGDGTNEHGPDAGVSRCDGTHSGSFRPHLVSTELQGQLPALERFVRVQFEDRPLKAGRWSISDRAFAEMLLTMVLLKPNADGSNPYRRHKEFIKALHSQGVFEHGYNHHRYKVVRDYLSSRLAIHWQDETWRAGSPGQEGKACRWGLDSVLIEQVEIVLGLREEEQEQQESTLVDTVQTYSGQYRVPTPAFVVLDFPEGYLDTIAAMFAAKQAHQLAA